MNKFKVFVVTAMAAAISMSVPATVNAASPYNTATRKYVVNYSSQDVEDVKGKLKEYGIDIDSPNSGSESCTRVKQEIKKEQSSKCTGTGSQTKPSGQAQTPKDTPVTKPVESVTPEKPQTDSGTGQTADTNTSAQNDKEQLTYAQQVVKLVNEERAKEGLTPLTIDTKVEAAANVRARETTSSFSHTRPNGTSFSTALKEQNVTYRMCGENIAYGQKSPEEVVKAWMSSPGHRANIMNEKFTTIGVGRYQAANGTIYWCQLFIG